MQDNCARERACEEICDFCSSPDLFFAYLACDFTATEVVVTKPCDFPFTAAGAWLACQECTCFIEGQRWEALLERALHTFRKVHDDDLSITPEDERLIREFLRRLHRQFREFQASRIPSAPRSAFSAAG
jgi:hypothetical protein